MKAQAPLLELTVTVPANPEQVWQALTDPSRLACWFPLHSEARDDNKLLLSWGKDCEWETHVTRSDPDHVQWMDVLPDGTDDGAVLPAVDFHIESDGRATTVRLVQSGFDPDSDWEGQYEALRRGWTNFLDVLSGYLEHHYDRTRTMIWRRGSSSLERTQLWTALLGGLGLAMSASEASQAAGQWLTAQLGDEALQAEVRAAESPHVLTLRLPELNEASLFIELEPGDENLSCGVWLSTYGLDESQVKRLEQAVEDWCGDLLSERE